jgi:hypothetical protein
MAHEVKLPFGPDDLMQAVTGLFLAHVHSAYERLVDHWVEEEGEDRLEAARVILLKQAIDLAVEQFPEPLKGRILAERERLAMELIGTFN